MLDSWITIEDTDNTSLRSVTSVRSMESLAVDGFSRGSLEKVEHLLREAKKYKEEGNAWYLSKDYRKAIRCYHQSLLYIKSITQGK